MQGSARKIALGFEVAHIGINTPDADASLEVCRQLNAAFGFETKAGNSSNFASSAVEVMKSNYLGENGHIAIRTNSITPACCGAGQGRLRSWIESTAKYKGDKMIAVYLKQQFGGFAVHLLQK